MSKRERPFPNTYVQLHVRTSKWNGQIKINNRQNNYLILGLTHRCFNIMKHFISLRLDGHKLHNLDDTNLLSVLRIDTIDQHSYLLLCSIMCIIHFGNKLQFTQQIDSKTFVDFYFPYTFHGRSRLRFSYQNGNYSIEEPRVNTNNRAIHLRDVLW